MKKSVSYLAFNDTNSLLSQKHIPKFTCRIILILFGITLFITIYNLSNLIQDNTRIIVITPTYYRKERLPDMIRMSQTLRHITNIHWIVVEDGNKTYPSVERILQRSNNIYTYLNVVTPPNYPHAGWTPRNRGLEYVRQHYKNYNGNAVVFFGDDDNTYDYRLFDRYIRKVKGIGLWAVGLVGGALVEAPRVSNGILTGFDVLWKPEREFPVDFCGFAMNLNLVLSKNATFTLECTTNGKDSESESCYLSQYNYPVNKAEIFGYDDDPKEILAWHTKTREVPVNGGNHGYVTE